MSPRGWGLMWQITNPKKALAESIKEACAHFRARFGVWPSLITVNEVALSESGIVQGEHVRGDRMTPPGHIHLWGVPK